MSDDERAAFLAARPSGAICVVGDDGRLLAVPARILNGDAGALRVELAETDLESMFDHERRGCVVADTFESYHAIRGVIARGRAARVDTAAAGVVLELEVARIATFSFAENDANHEGLRP